MTDPLKKLTEDMKKIHLTSDEKSDMRGNLLQFMKENPMPKKARAKAKAKPTTSHHDEEKRPNFLASFLTFLVPRPMPVLAAMMIIAVSGGTVSFAATGSLPGDLLYPVKVGINEEIVSMFSLGEESKLEWEIERSSRRLTEAGRLESEGTLDSEALSALGRNIETHNSRIKTLESRLQSQGETDSVVALQQEYESKLRLYETLLFEILTADSVAAEPEMGVAAEPEMGVAAEPEMGVAAEPEMGVAAEPEMGVAAEPEMGLAGQYPNPRAVRIEAPVFVSSSDYATDTEQATLSDLIEGFREAKVEETPSASLQFIREAKTAMDDSFSRYSEASRYVNTIAQEVGYDLMQTPISTLEKAGTRYNEGQRLFNRENYYEAYALFTRSLDLSKIAMNESKATLSEVEAERERNENNQEEWRGKAKSQALMVDDTFEEINNYVQGLIDKWGYGPFGAAQDQLSIASTYLQSGHSNYQGKAFSEAYRLFTLSYEATNKATQLARQALTDVSTPEPVPSPTQISTPQPEPIPTPQSEPQPTPELVPVPEPEPTPEPPAYLSEAQTAMDRSFKYFLDISQYVDEVAHTTGYDAVSRPLSLLNDAQALFNKGNVQFQAQAYKEAYTSFTSSYDLLGQIKEETSSLLEAYQPPAEVPPEVEPGVTPGETTPGSGIVTPDEPEIDEAALLESASELRDLTAKKLEETMLLLSEISETNAFREARIQLSAAGTVYSEGDRYYWSRKFEAAMSSFKNAYEMLEEAEALFYEAKEIQ
jgi:hypothetical protein